MKLTIIVFLLSFSLTSFAKDKPSDQTKTKDIFQEVRDIMR